MAKDKIKVSVIIDRQALIDKAFRAAETQKEFNEIRLIIEDSDEFVRDATQLEDKEKREAHNNGFSSLALDIILNKHSDTEMAKHMSALRAMEDESNKSLYEAYENLKKKLGEDHPFVTMIDKVFNSRED